MYKTASRSKTNSTFVSDLSIAIKALSIANAILWIGSIAYAIVEKRPIFPLLLFEFDLALIVLVTSFYAAITNPITLTMALLGWVVAGVYVRKKAGDRSSKIIFIASLIPSILFTSVVSLILLSVTLTSELIILLPLVLIFMLLMLISNAGAFMLAVPGVIVSNFIKHENRIVSQRLSQPNYLILTTIPPTHNEKENYCPFKMQTRQGCSFLGYIAPNEPLICDYESQWRRCYIYAHIYENLDEELKK